MKKLHLHFYLLLLPILFFSCVKDELDFVEYNYLPEDYATISKTLDLPEQPYDYNLKIPNSNFFVGIRPRNVSKNMATLGRVLFYDKSMSKNGVVSCASCHKQAIAFADELKLSKGFDGGETHRNSIALGSVVGFAAVYGSSSEPGTAFFWDERAPSAAAQSRMSFTDAIEMGMTMSEVVNTVRSKDYYQTLFRATFQDEKINEERILLALESFVDAIGSFNSKMDKAMIRDGGFNMQVGRNLTGFSVSENRGKDLFLRNCSSCHGDRGAGPVIRRANNGLDLVYTDKGIGGISNLAELYGVFKVPSLRNIELTGPYMHDGRFENLVEVLNFYNEGIQAHPNLGKELQVDLNEPIRMGFTEEDKSDLISFLKTMTDTEFLTDVKFSDPFK
ncbi:MAG: cytochrome c peroxidase [Bacteroidota bacterium]